jgi:DNA-binding transcriptional ArsR family regulator
VSVTLLLGAQPEEAVAFGISALAELTAMLHACADPAHHHAESLAARARDQVSPHLADGITRFAPMWGSYRARFLLPGPLGLGQSLESELAAIEALPPSEFRLLAAFAVSGGYTGRRFENLRISTAAREDLLQRARARSEEAAALADMLLNDAAKFQAALLETLREFAAAVFDAEWSSVARLLMSEVAEKQQLARWRGAAQALAAVGAGTRVFPDPPRVVFDQLHHGVISLDRQRLLVMPSAFGAPHQLIKHEANGWPAIIHYPLAAASADEASQIETVRRRLGILADPERLHLSRILAHDSLPTVELARRAGSTPPQVSRQLRVLRDAGLVTATRRGRYVHYRLDLDRITSLGPELLEALLR